MSDLTLRRLAEPALTDRLGRAPVVVVSGLRQSGKTTLVRKAPGQRRFESLDSLTTLDRARREPEALVRGGQPMTIDEVQRAPDLLLAIKHELEGNRRPGRFLLTGSANLLLMSRVSESLAGRAVYLELRPFTEREKHGVGARAPWRSLLSARTLHQAQAILSETPATASRPAWRFPHAALAGGLPPAALAPSSEDRSLWFDGYVDTYLQRDLRDLAQIGDLPGFLRFARIVALRTGGLLNQADLARDAAIPRATAQRWLALLELSFLVKLVPAFATSRTKRLIKAPKVFFGDTGLALHLAAVRDEDGLRAEPNCGAYLESIVLNDLLAFRGLTSPRPDIFHYRSAGGEEIDFILEDGRKLLPIEVKARRTLRTSDARALDGFCEERGIPFGVLLYEGREMLPLTRHTLAVPVDVALGAG